METDKNPLLESSVIELQPDEAKKADEYRKSHNTAALTILFTDIVGFTAFTESAGEAASEKLRHLHDSLFVEAIRKSGAGEIIEQVGASFLSVFAEPSAAVSCALEFQKMLSDHSSELTQGNYTLKVRIGIHMGQVSVENTFQHDIFGTHVNRASGIESIAGGGQILTSQPVWDNASAWLKGNKLDKVRSRYCGKARLKGIKEPTRVYEFFFDDLGPRSIPRAITIRKRQMALVGLAFLIPVVIILFILMKRERSSQKEVLSGQPDTIFFANMLPPVGGDLGSERFENDFRLAYDEKVVWQDSFKFKPISSSLLDSLDEETLSALISVTYPDYVVIRESDVNRNLHKKGEIALSFLDSLDDWENMRRFMKAAGCREGLLIRVMKFTQPSQNDSLAATIEIVNDWGNISWASMMGKNPLALSDRVSSQYKEILTNWIKMKQRGTILSFSGEQGTMSFSQGMHLRKGAALSVVRSYGPSYLTPTDSGIQKRLLDLKELKMAFGSDELWKQSVTGYLWSFDEYEDLSQGTIRFGGDGAAQWGTGIDMRVEEVYDSTATVRVLNREIPHVQVRVGDELFMK